MGALLVGISGTCSVGVRSCFLRRHGVQSFLNFWKERFGGVGALGEGWRFAPTLSEGFEGPDRAPLRSSETSECRVLEVQRTRNSA
eukprot:6596939-Alexandrium_andersonii.AAC.1